jgi:hypothetical protein
MAEGVEGIRESRRLISARIANGRRKPQGKNGAKKTLFLLRLEIVTFLCFLSLTANSNRGSVAIDFGGNCEEKAKVKCLEAGMPGSKGACVQEVVSAWAIFLSWTARIMFLRK